MNTRTLTRPLGALLLAAVLAVPAAKAVVLDFATSGLGYWSPASAFNNDAEVTTAANAVVTWYNGGANPNPNPDAVFTLAAGTGVPAPALPSPLTFGYKDDDGSNGWDSFSPAGYEYVLAKYGNVSYLFYIGNLAPGTYTLPTTGPNGLGLSHIVLFDPRSVPDEGTTIALLGFGLLCVEGLRRKLGLLA